jgi:hypothetical protein
MPKGPKGQKRPADVIGMRIATGEIEDCQNDPKEYARKGGLRALILETRILAETCNELC